MSIGGNRYQYHFPIGGPSDVGAHRKHKKTSAHILRTKTKFTTLGLLLLSCWALHLY